jgi:RNA polymerase sigma-70 factor (ECF subfamily)
MTAVAHVWMDFDEPRPSRRLPAAPPARSAPGGPPIHAAMNSLESDPVRLIEAVALNADRMAFAALFSQFAPRVKSYLLRLGAPAAAAEELVQETMLTVWRKAALFDPSRAGVSTWIFTIARNLRIDAIRRERPAPASEDPSDGEPQPMADQMVFAAEREARVRAALKTLPAEQVQIVELSFFSEEPHSAIAERLGLPLGTVKSRLRLAMSRLRGLLEDVR